MPTPAKTTNHPQRDRPRQVLTWAVIVLIVAVILIVVIEAIRNEPATAPMDGTSVTLATSSSHLYSHTDEVA